MPSINNQPVLPGIFTQVQQQLLPSVTGGIRVAALIGTGRLTNLVVGESVTRGSVDTTANIPFTVTTVTDATHLVVSSTVGMTAGDTIVQGSHTTTITTVTDGTHLVVGSTSGWLVDTNNDALVHTATVLDGTTITDQNFAVYESGVDYSATPVSGGVGWLSSAASITGTATLSFPLSALTGQTLSISVAGGSIQSYTFMSGDVTNSTTLTSAIDSNFTGITSAVTSNHLVLTTIATFNTSITIENGTANPTFGFVAGSLVSAPSRPALGVVYFVNYEWAKVAADYTPKFYFLQNFSTITNDVGNVGGGNDGQTANMLVPTTANPSATAWTLPIAAQLAQQNGASIICLMQMNPADGANASQVRAALTKLFIPNINIVVSLDAADNAMLIPDITNHVETASSTINRLERTAFIGFSASDPSFTSQTTMLGYATAADSNRVVVVNQTSTIYSMFIGTSTTASTVDGTMMAAALAAIRTNPAFDVAQPLTRSVVSGIALTNNLPQASEVILSNNGVLVMDNISGSAKVVFGTTTEFADILDQLYQVTEIADYCTQTIRGLLDPIFIGQKLLANTPSQVETVTSAILSDIESSNIIESFTQPTATVNPSQPTQILVNVGVQPVLELDTIFITLGLNLV